MLQPSSKAVPTDMREGINENLPQEELKNPTPHTSNRLD